MKNIMANKLHFYKSTKDDRENISWLFLLNYMLKMSPNMFESLAYMTQKSTFTTKITFHVNLYKTI